MNLFCVNCRHCFIERPDNVEFAKCHSPLNYTQGVSPVTGKSTAHYLTAMPHCRDQRILGKCGPDAAWFEPITQEIAA